ncbi:UbiH/UbiF family hydroxylase [Falsirhodobacter algicola]|uniref:UbiH/UbiF family hydroxylase n=1 Tax=Falsirhodobacter algicola TaxID=2692330 RepID=A0A8J8MQR4_9RHOB|nr:UbiH/UbiF family hydroxylase [Falsirhodobacter algicola]QUS34921.1 UbiH/UbiF family hydroxylase [Falsirhodobacter algicola]
MKTDILVSGGGIAGLTAAAAFGSAGYDVICVDPVTDPPEDLRSTAFLQPAIPVLEAAGLWDVLSPEAAPLQVMRIVDAGGVLPEPRVVTEFNAAEISDAPFGWNLPNTLLRRVMTERLAALPNVRHLRGAAAQRLATREAEARVTLSDGGSVQARLVIAADGRDSAMRRAAGIEARVTRYGQKALAFRVGHRVPHENVSTEVHRSGGPFTLVPLPDRDGQHQSAVVWMEAGPEAERLRALPPEDLSRAATERSAGVLGELTLASGVGIFPIIAQIATRMAGERLALMAEAAHVMPPIGAQGLNTSLADLAALLDLARPETLGSAAMLEAYHRRRHGTVRLRAAGIGALNRASMLAPPMMRDLRAALLGGLHAARPLRRALMRAGMGR